MLDLVELCVAELTVLDKESQRAICELIPIGTPRELRSAGTDEGQVCPAVRPRGAFRERPELGQSRES